MEIILVPVIEAIWRKVVDSFSSRVVDQTVDNALNSVQNIADFEAVFESLMKNLKSLSARAADVDEEINNQERSGRKKRKREVKEWLEEVESIKQVVVELGGQMESEGFVTRLTDGGKAAQLDKQVEKLVEQSRNFGDYVLDVCGTSGDTFLTDGMVGKAFTENLGRIMELLQNREVLSIGVYGMGGVGKTALAKHVNNLLMQQAEGRVLWVTVSQEFTIRSLQDKIARQLGINLSDEDEEDMRATRLHRAFSREKNSVLILDDVWEDIDMKKVGCLFSVDGCRLIVTTRSLEVCNRICCERVIRVGKLDEEEAWKLFNETLGDKIELGRQVEGVAKSVAKMCDGLPLGIIVVAGGMRGEDAIHTWRNALAGLKDRVAGLDGLGDIKVYKVLKYSFDQLKRDDESKSNEHNMIQDCFMYCSLYPEDNKIVRDDLVSKFVSGGLLDGRKGRRAQIEQGHCILDRLVKVCLLESCVGDYDDKCVKMHDLVRGMALRIGEGKYMARGGNWSLTEIPNEEEWTEGLQKVSVMESGIRKIEDGISPNCPNLSMLLLCSNKIINFISDSFFSKMHVLCTLDLSRCSEVAMLPNSVSDLTSLKALLLEDCYKLEMVPYLGNLKALRELNLSDTAIKEAPPGLEELVNLRFLSMNASGLKMLPRAFFLKLGNLQHLDLPINMKLETEEIKSMKQLQEFGGGVENVDDFNRFVITREHECDPCYRIGVNACCSSRSRFKINDDAGRRTKRLVLCGCNLKDEKVLGQGIVDLTIAECECLSMCFGDDLPRLNNPASLRILEIMLCGGIECIMRSNCRESEISSTLEEVYLCRLEDLRELMQRGQIGGASTSAAPPLAPAQPVYCFLKRLQIGYCNKMRKLGLPASGIPNLEEIEIGWCDEVEEIFDDEGRGCITILPKLSYLELQGLPRLKCVSKATLICSSIATIIITRCPRLMNKLPLHFDVAHLPPSLQQICVEREWWESLDWGIHPNLPQLLHPFLDLDASPSTLAASIFRYKIY